MQASFQDLSVLLVEPSGVQSRIIADLLAGLDVTESEVVDSGRQRWPGCAWRCAGSDHQCFLPAGRDRVDLLHQMRADEALATRPFVLVSSGKPGRRCSTRCVNQAPAPFCPNHSASSSWRPRCAPSSIISARAPCSMSIYGSGAILRVLLVDDSPNARKYVRHILGNLGIEEFIEAENGIEGQGNSG